MELEKAPCEARFSATSPTKNWRFSTSYDSFVVIYSALRVACNR